MRKLFLHWRMASGTRDDPPSRAIEASQHLQRTWTVCGQGTGLHAPITMAGGDHVDATNSAGKRKRSSEPVSPCDDAPSKKQHDQSANNGSDPGETLWEETDAAASMVVVKLPSDAVAGWPTVMQKARAAGEYIDVVLVVAQRRIPAHKNVLGSLSPYLHALLTWGSTSESAQTAHEITLEHDAAQADAVKAIVDSFYTGTLSLSRNTVASIIRGANLLQVGVVEKAACDFFVQSLDLSTACDALAFAAAHVECGEHARDLQTRCVRYVAENFAHCAADSSFLKLSAQAILQLIGNDHLPRDDEQRVLDAARAWYDADAAGRKGVLQLLVQQIRWPLLPAAVQLGLTSERLLQCMMREGEAERNVVMDLLLECSKSYANSAAASTCPRLKRRMGRRELCFTAWSEQHYSRGSFRRRGQLGQSLRPAVREAYYPALCSEHVMNKGRSCAEFQLEEYLGLTVEVLVGVARPTLDVEERDPSLGPDYWGVLLCDEGSCTGTVWHDGKETSLEAWYPAADDLDENLTCHPGDRVRMLLDSDAGTLTVKINDRLLGVAVESGLTGDLCWALCFGPANEAEVEITSIDPQRF